MNISDVSIDITNRFFEAIEALKAQKKMRGLQTFSDNHGFNRWNLLTLRKEPTTRVLKPEYIYYLCQDYNISLEWLFYGKGQMYKRGIPPKTNTKHKPKEQIEESA